MWDSQKWSGAIQSYWKNRIKQLCWKEYTEVILFNHLPKAELTSTSDWLGQDLFVIQ